MKDWDEVYYESNPYYLTEKVESPEEFFNLLSIHGIKEKEIWDIFRMPAYIITGGRGTGKTLIGKFISYRFQKYFYDNLRDKKEYSELIKILDEALQGKKFWGVYSKVENPRYLYTKDEKKAREYSYILGTTLDLKITEELCRSLINLLVDYDSSHYVKDYIGLKPKKINEFVHQYFKILEDNFNLSESYSTNINNLHEKIKNIYESYRNGWDKGPEKNKPFCILKFTSAFIEKLREIAVINSNIRIIIILDEVQWFEKLPHEFALRLLNEFIYKIAREPEFNCVNLILIGRTYGFRVKKCLSSDEVIEKSRGVYGVLNLNKLWEDKFTKYQQMLEDIFIMRWKGLKSSIDTKSMFQLWWDKHTDFNRSNLNLIYGSTLKRLVKKIKKDEVKEPENIFDQLAQELGCNNIAKKMYLLAIIADLKRKNKIKQEIVLDEHLKRLVNKYLSDKNLEVKYNKKIKWVVSNPIERFFGWDCLTKICHPYVANFLDVLKRIDGKESLKQTLFKAIRREVQYDSILSSSRDFIEEISSLVPSIEYLQILENIAILLKEWQGDLSIIEFPIGVKIDKERINNEDLSMLRTAESYDVLSINENSEDDCWLIKPASPTVPYYRLCPFAEDYVKLDKFEILKSKKKDYVKDYARNRFKIIGVYINLPKTKNEQKYFWEGI